MRIRYDAAQDTVIVELSDRPQQGPLTPVPHGIWLGRDAEGLLVRLEVREASSRVPSADLAGTELGPDPEARCPESQEDCAVVAYSDGACRGNPGPGGWACRLLYGDGRILELGGAAAETTNNRMEMTAAIEALRMVRDCPSVTMVTDSEYLRKGITQWIHQWKRRGWVTAARKPVLNRDLWQRLDELNHSGVAWEYVRGHAGHPDNERCDELAQAFARGECPALRRA